jgi:hypothetical protein
VTKEAKHRLRIPNRAATGFLDVHRLKTETQRERSCLTSFAEVSPHTNPQAAERGLAVALIKVAWI